MSIQSGSKIRVAVLRGGPTPDYERSLKTGEHVLSILRENPEAYTPVDIFISKSGEWHQAGVHREPHKALEYSDVVFNALHGYGEDGTIQRLLSSMRLPYTGSSNFGTVMSLNKDMAKSVYLSHGLNTPRSEIITSDDELDKLVEIFRNYLHPVVIKPSNENSRRGIKLVYKFEDLVKAVDEALNHSPKVVIEEFIRGREAKCIVVENFRGDKHYAFVPIEVITPMRGKNMPDYDSKFNHQHEYQIGGSFKPAENKVLEHVAKKAHEALGLRHFSSSDLIMTPQGKVYVLESSPLPDFSKDSMLHKSLNAIGSTPEAFLDHVLRMAIQSL